MHFFDLIVWSIKYHNTKQDVCGNKTKDKRLASWNISKVESFQQRFFPVWRLANCPDVLGWKHSDAWSCLLCGSACFSKPDQTISKDIFGLTLLSLGFDV